MQAESAGSMSDRRQATHTHPTLQPQRDRTIWRLKFQRKRTCEHPRRLDSAAYILTDQESKLVSRTCDASPQVTSTPLIWLTYRNHTARRAKSGVYAEVVCRKRGEKSSDERQSHLDTSATPVCPLFLQYLREFISGYPWIGMFLQHPRSALRSE